jgi:hypothetical protein
LCDRGNAEEKRLIASVSDGAVETDLPIFGLDEEREVASFIARKLLGWVYNGMWERT